MRLCQQITVKADEAQLRIKAHFLTGKELKAIHSQQHDNDCAGNAMCGKQGNEQRISGQVITYRRRWIANQESNAEKLVIYFAFRFYLTLPKPFEGLCIFGIFQKERIFGLSISQ